MLNLTISETRMIWLDKVWRSNIDDFFNQFDRLGREQLASKPQLHDIDRAAQEAISDVIKVRDVIRTKIAVFANRTIVDIANQLVDEMAGAIAQSATNEANLQSTALSASAAVLDRTKLQARQLAQEKVAATASQNIVREVCDAVLVQLLDPLADDMLRTLPDGVSNAVQIKRSATEQVKSSVENMLSQFRAVSIPLGDDIDAIKNTVRNRINTLRQRGDEVDGQIGQLASADPPDDPPDYPKVNQSAIWLPLQLSISSFANDFQAIDTWPFLIQMDILNADIKQMLCTTP